MPDLAGLNPDMATLRKSVGAFRPHLEKVLRERYGSELLALYAYPAQVTFCAKPLASLADLAGRRVRVSSAPQSDWVSALGGTPVQTPFAEIVANVRNGNIDCAITGTMSGNTIGLHEVMSHLHTRPVNWGVAAFVANGAAWNALPKDCRTCCGASCRSWSKPSGAKPRTKPAPVSPATSAHRNCTGGRKGRMTLVNASAADAARRRDILVGQRAAGLAQALWCAVRPSLEADRRLGQRPRPALNRAPTATCRHPMSSLQSGRQVLAIWGTVTALVVAAARRRPPGWSSAPSARRLAKPRCACCDSSAAPRRRSIAP